MKLSTILLFLVAMNYFISTTTLISSRRTNNRYKKLRTKKSTTKSALNSTIRKKSSSKKYKSKMVNFKGKNSRLRKADDEVKLDSSKRSSTEDVIKNSDEYDDAEEEINELPVKYKEKLEDSYIRSATKCEKKCDSDIIAPKSCDRGRSKDKRSCKVEVKTHSKIDYVLIGIASTIKVINECYNLIEKLVELIDYIKTIISGTEDDVNKMKNDLKTNAKAKILAKTLLSQNLEQNKIRKSLLDRLIDLEPQGFAKIFHSFGLFFGVLKEGTEIVAKEVKGAIIGSLPYKMFKKFVDDTKIWMESTFVGKIFTTIISFIFCGSALAGLVSSILESVAELTLALGIPTLLKLAFRLGASIYYIAKFIIAVRKVDSINSDYELLGKSIGYLIKFSFLFAGIKLKK